MYWKKILLSITLFLCSHAFLFSQNTKAVYHIKRTTEPIRLDGLIDEVVWESAQIAQQFFLEKPYDTSYATAQTEVRVLFDDQFIYVAAKAYQPRNAYTVSSFKRDYLGGTSDVFTVNIDTFRDRLNGFQFGVSPLNVQREGLISNGQDVDNSWDNRWFSEVKNYQDYWTVEIAIPFKTLRYKVVEGENAWHINFGRSYMQINEVSNWSPVPRNFRSNNLGFAGTLVWDDTPPTPSKNIAFIPYASSGIIQDFPRTKSDLQELPKSTDRNLGFGFDAKVAVTPSLNLDITVNPDFSQVEVDQQQTNLSRFELFFPERRQFFIENADLFGNFGFPDTRAFFSRRIGIARNPRTGLAQQVPIQAGLRLSGKLNNDWRIGVLNMQTRQTTIGSDQLPAANYSVVTAQRKLFTRSAISGFIVNKETFLNGIDPSQQVGLQAFNRVAGLEFNFFTPDNRWEIESYAHQSISPEQRPDAASIGQYIGYHHPNIDLNFAISRIGENYQAEVGYVPRNGIYSLFRPYKLILNPRKASINKYINSYGIGTGGKDIFDLSGKRLDSETAFFLFFTSPDRSEFSTGYFRGFTYLFNPFDPTNATDNPDPRFYQNVIPLPIGGYRYEAFFLNLETSSRRDLQAKIDWFIGDYFNGKGTGLNSSLAYRVQPYGTFTIDANFTAIDLPKPYNSVRYLLIGPRAELTFSRSVFLSTFFQYNTQTNNTNINTRLQWRFRPVSDLFLVYTDNYFAQPIAHFQVPAWAPKNRALILKFTYWLNV